MSMATCFLMGFVRRVWTVLDDFTPKRTIDEVARLTGDVKRQIFDAHNEAVLTRLRAEREATSRMRTLVTAEQRPALNARLEALQRIEQALYADRRDVPAQPRAADATARSAAPTPRDSRLADSVFRPRTGRRREIVI